VTSSELVLRFGGALVCLALVCGCGAKKENQSANESQALKETQASKSKESPPAQEEQDAASAEDWPRQIIGDGNRLTYYQPQIDSWTADYRQLDGRVAVVLTPSGGESVRV